MSFKTVTLCIFALASSFLFPAAFAAEGVSRELKGGWNLIWHDEFDGRSLDLSKWLPAAAALEKNHEAQYYSPNNAYLENGCLVLKSERKKVGKRPYTSALVETTGLFSLTYGRVEVRAKLPGGQGIWPAHWLMPEDNSWPPEIDMMELLGHDPTRVYMHLHYGEDWQSHRSTGESFRGPNFTEDFHVFAVEWEKDEIRWFIDGMLRHTVRENIPAAKMRIILNTAVGGDWPGYPNKRTQFPQYHLIDYVRVYKREG
jgi:beta-glucanase (GH16 family)